MNKIILSGNLCRDIETNYYNNKLCLRNSIAVKRDFKNKNNEYDTDFFNITLWGQLAEYIKNYADKGTKVLIAGRLLNNEYEAEDGTKKHSNEVQVESIEILSERKNKDEVELTPEEAFGENKEEKPTSIDDFLD